MRDERRPFGQWHNFTHDTTVTLRTSKLADMAAKWWDAGLVEEINGYDADDYANQVYHASVTALFWADCQGYDKALAKELSEARDWDALGNGDADVELSSAHLDYDADNLDSGDREILQSDAEGFVRMAWPWLVQRGTEPDQVGRDLHLTRNGHGAGFWDGDYGDAGDALTELSKPFGSISVQVGLDEDGDAVEFQLLNG
jgi:hypothetical protein